MSWLISLLIAGSIFGSDAAVTAPGAPEFYETQTKIEENGSETERFEQTYRLNPNGRVSVSNISGMITISTWDREQVKLEVIKSADSKELLNDIDVTIDSNPDSFSVSADYPSKSNWGRTSRVSVDFKLTVPKGATVKSVETVNGTITISDVLGGTKAQAVNGQIRATNLGGDCELSTVNGTVVAEFDNVPASGRIAIGTVNGRASVTLPSDVNAVLRADTLSGSIANEFGLTVRKGEYVGRDMYGKIGNGGVTIRMNSLNGALYVKRKADGKTTNPAVDLAPDRSAPDAPDFPDAPSVAAVPDLATMNSDLKKAMEEARRELEKARPEIEKAAALAAKESALARLKDFPDAATIRKLRTDAERLRATTQNRYRGLRWAYNPPVVDVKSESFDFKGTPTVTVDGGNAEISVRGWDQKTVRYSVSRIADRRQNKDVEVKAEKSGDDLRISIGKPNCEDCEDVEYRIEVMVPKKSNLRLKSTGEIRLEGVSGELEIEGGDESVNVRESNGTLAVRNTDGRVRVIGFSGDVTAKTMDGEIALEGDIRKLDASSVDGNVIVTLTRESGATVRSNSESVEAAGFVFSRSNDSGNSYQYTLGNGGSEFKFTTVDGRLIIRNQDSVMVGK